MPAPSFLKGLPKPILFGLYGAVGGLLGALVFGELVWRSLKPKLATVPPQVAVAASDKVTLYPKSANTFAVRVIRERFDKPVTVKFDKLPPGLTIASLEIPAGTGDATATVTATDEAKVGEYEVSLKAEAEGVEPASAPFKVIVQPTPPPPPGLAVAIPTNLTLYKRGTSSFKALVARRNYDGPIVLAIDGLPAGVTFAPKEVPVGATEVDVTLTAAAEAVVGSAKLKVNAAVADPPLNESAATQLAVQTPPIAPVDIVFVLDVTSSMQWAIDDLKNGIGKFADTLSGAQLDFRLGLVTFQDLTVPGEKVEVVQFKNGDKLEPFTASAATFRDKVGLLKADGGGDIPESSLEAISEATKMPFRQGTSRILLLITDAPAKVTKTTLGDACDQVKEKGIDSVHLVVQKVDLDVYKRLMTAGGDKTGGKYFNLGDVVRGDEGFDPLLKTFGTAVTDAARAKTPEGKPQVADAPSRPPLAATAAATPKAAEAPAPPSVKSVQSSGDFEAGSEKKLTLAIGVWTGAIAALVCLALLAGQHHYLRGSFPAIGGVLAGLLGGLVVGTAGGAAGQGLFMLAADSPTLGTVFRVLGWALLGGLAGAGLSLFIPNMKWFLGLAGGAIGGAIGAAGYIAVTAEAGDFVGRIVGGLLLGFCIGLMVAIVEAAFRRAWLEVRYGREIITVNLGPEPVKVGGDAKACTVWARGAAPIALRFFVREGKVICDDPTMRRETPVDDGFSKEVGNVTVVVRTGSSAAAVAPKPAPPQAAMPKKPVADDDFDLPMPIPSRAAVPAPPKPPLAVVPKPPTPAPLSLDDDPLPLPPPPKPVAPPQAAKPVVKPPVPTPPQAAKPPAPPVPTPPKPAAPPVPAAKVPAPPKPAAPPVPTAKPPVPKPAAPAQAAKPAPPAPPQAAQPPKPTTPPTAGKNPDACPSCGRVNAGKPKQRYCMVCDLTY